MKSKIAISALAIVLTATASQAQRHSSTRRSAPAVTVVNGRVTMSTTPAPATTTQVSDQEFLSRYFGFFGF